MSCFCIIREYVSFSSEKPQTRSAEKKLKVYMRPQIQQERHTGHTENILFVDVEYSGFNLIMEAITKIWPGL